MPDQQERQPCNADAPDPAGTVASATDASTDLAACPLVYVVCRRGNDSQHVVELLREHGVSSAQDLVGGLTAWSKDVDESFPTY